jgi:hypothetical protein
VYQQGETLEQALERVHGIVVDPEAGRAQRDAMHPSLETVAGEEQALERVHGIVVDPEAGRAQRDAMHPSLETVAGELRRPSRIMLTELAANGYIALELLDLPDADLEAIADPHYRHHVARRWTPTSPLARAARAAGSYLQAGGADLTRVRLMSEAVFLPDMAFGVEAREDWLGSLVHQTGREDMTEAVFVLRPNLKRPLRALRIVPLDAGGLRDIADLDIWLSEHAHHIGHLTNGLDEDPAAGWRSAASTPPPPTGPPPRGSR